MRGVLEEASNLPQSANEREDRYVSRALCQCCSIREDDSAQVHDTCSTESLECSSDEQHDPGLCTRAQSTANQNPKHLELQRKVATKDFGELARGGHKGGKSQRVGSDDPVEAARELVCSGMLDIYL
jgi:hypothetical protein